MELAIGILKKKKSCKKERFLLQKNKDETNSNRIADGRKQHYRNI